MYKVNTKGLSISMKKAQQQLSKVLILIFRVDTVSHPLYNFSFPLFLF